MQATPRTEELVAFRAFCEVVALPMGQFTFAEAPDFVKLDGSVGVELVEYHRDEAAAGRSGSPRRRWEAQLDQLLGSASRLVQSRSGPRLDVYAFPCRRPLRVIPRGADECLAEYVIAEPQPEELPVVLRHVFEDVRSAPTPSYQAEPRWQVVLADWLDVNPTAVQALLDEKEQKIAAYRAKASELWLVIYGSRMPSVGLSSGGRWSTHGRISAELMRATFRSSFDKVYYLDRDQQRCQTLLTAVL